MSAKLRLRVEPLASRAARPFRRQRPGKEHPRVGWVGNPLGPLYLSQLIDKSVALKTPGFDQTDLV